MFSNAMEIASAEGNIVQLKMGDFKAVHALIMDGREHFLFPWLLLTAT